MSSRLILVGQFQSNWSSVLSTGKRACLMQRCTQQSSRVAASPATNSAIGQLQLEQVGPARELQGRGLGGDAPADGQDVGDVLGADGVQLEPVVECALDGVLAVQREQGEDLAQVYAYLDLLCLESIEMGPGGAGKAPGS